jgi:hypothetical protein
MMTDARRMTAPCCRRGAAEPRVKNSPRRIGPSGPPKTAGSAAAAVPASMMPARGHNLADAGATPVSAIGHLKCQADHMSRAAAG